MDFETLVQYLYLEKHATDETIRMEKNYMMDSVRTLQYKCIRVITSEFKKFYAFKNSSDAHLQRQFQFLVRVYSFEILEQLHKTGDLEEKYKEVFVNQHLKVLLAEWFNDSPWAFVTKKFAEVGSNITQIIILDNTEARAWHRIFQYLRNLECMYFEGCNDEILRCIAQFCPNIKEIHVQYSLVTNEGMEYLCMEENGKPLCPKLKHVVNGCTDVDFAGVFYLVKNMKTLEVIDHNSLGRAVFQSILENHRSGLPNTPYNLKSLDLLPGFTNIHDPEDLNLCNELCIPLCPRLKSLKCLIQKEEHLNLFPYELDNLELQCSSVPKINVSNFLKYKGRTLTTLSLSECLLSVVTFAESCPCLMFLAMEKVRFTNELEMQRVRFDKDNFSPLFHHLNVCTFRKTVNEDATVKSISLILTSSPKLRIIYFETLNLSSKVLNREILKACKYYPRNEVYFRNSEVGMDFAKDFIKNCHALEWVELTRCDVNKKDAVEFHTFAQTLSNNRVVLAHLDDEDKVDFTAKLFGKIPEFKFSKSRTSF